MEPLRIVQYPHPALRHKSKPLTRVDGDVRRIVREMFDLMYEAQGIGLAANQVALPYRMFVVNPTGDQEQADQEMVFINPELSAAKGSEEKEEGCLSLPELYAPVRRPQTVDVRAFTLAGEEVQATLDGLLSRVVQHETDHLDGVLFIDRLSETERLNVKQAVEDFETQYRGQLGRGEVPGEEMVAEQMAELERLRT